MAKKYLDYVTSFNALGYNFRLNEMNDIVECNRQRLTDTLDAEIKSKMGDIGFVSRPKVEESWKRLAGASSYHPIKEYFQNLPAWGGQDVFGQLMQYFTFKHRAFSHTAIRKFMIGAIAKVFERHQNYMLIVDGSQGIGKSFFVNWLCPMDKYFLEGALNPDHNDTKLRVMSHFLWEVGEFQSTTRKADQEALKNIISQKFMTARRPYAHYDMEKPIIVSFVGTINENGTGFQTDPTGSRRFATIHIETINHEYSKIVSLEQLWAQMYTSYISGEKGIFDKHEREMQEKINMGYETQSMAVQIFHANYDIDIQKHIDDWTPIADIIYTLEIDGLKIPQRLAQMEISALLKKEGCDNSDKNKTTGKGRRMCYSGIKEKQKVSKSSQSTGYGSP